MLQISTTTLKDRKKVEIDGQPYTVRRLGAGEQLTLNQMLRQAKALEAKLKEDTVNEGDEIEAENLSQKMMDIFTGLFDDGGDGSKARDLVRSLNENEIQELFTQIFKDDSDATPDVS